MTTNISLEQYESMKLRDLYAELAARVRVLEEKLAVAEPPQGRQAGWAIIFRLFPESDPFIFCGRDGFLMVRWTLQKDGVEWVVWFASREAAEHCVRLAQLGDDCKVVQLDRETLEEVGGEE